MAKIYSDEEIEQLSKNPCVLHVSRHQMSLTLEFRQVIYEEWVISPTYSTIKRVLEANGFNTAELGANFVRNIGTVFNRAGKPKFARSPRYDAEATAYGKSCEASPMVSSSVKNTMKDQKQIREALVSTGKFIRSGRGIWFAPDFEKNLREAYPEKSIKQSLEEAGIDPKCVGYSRIKRLERSFRESGADTPPDPKAPDIPPMIAESLLTNPYVSEVTADGITLSESFFALAAILAELPVDEILDVFLITPSAMTVIQKASVSERLRETEPMRWSGMRKQEGTLLEAEVLCRRETALVKAVSAGYDKIRGILSHARPSEKKKICQLLDSLPRDPANEFTKREILKSIGMSKTSYYMYVGKEDFGTADAARLEQDEKDVSDVRLVFEYKGFRKGYRQVYMLFPRLMGRKLGLKKIRRLMKIGGMACGVRGANPARRSAAVREERAVKPNLLRRRFRLHRPNRVRVTDVTVLVYGGGMKGYGSALMDPVTARLIAFVISESEGLELAIETLRQSDNHPCEDGGIFHSDQGVLYKTSDFQKEVLARGLNQSMSKKGNCWDNASQESFFGHFKDECSYQDCEAIEELKKRVAEYTDYYNNERGMWEKCRMTPVEYEEYLLNMDDEEFGRYLEKEEERYKKMKEHAVRLAKKRYGTLGV